MDIDIAMLEDWLARCDGDGVKVAVNASTRLQGAKYIYKYLLEKSGSTSEATLQSGLFYATRLDQAHRGIEAERLIVKLAASSRCVHGPGHNCSISLDEKVKNASHAMLLSCLIMNCSRLFDMKMMEKFVSSRALSNSQGRKRMREYFMLQINL